LISFLCDVALDEYVNNIFGKGYGEERAFKDGEAHQANKFLQILQGIENG